MDITCLKRSCLYHDINFYLEFILVIYLCLRSYPYYVTVQRQLFILLIINVFWDDFMGDYPFLPHVTQLKAGETFRNMAAPMPSLVLAGSLLGWRWELYFLSGIFTTDCLGPLIARTFLDVPKYMVSLSATYNRPLSVFLNIASMDHLVS